VSRHGAGLLAPPERLADSLARSYGAVQRAAVVALVAQVVPVLLAGDDAQLPAAVQRAGDELELAVPDSRIERDARRAAEQVDDRHRRLFFAGLATALGVRLLGTDSPTGRSAGLGGVPPLLPPGTAAPPPGGPRWAVRVNLSPTILTDQFAVENVRLISTLRRGMVEAVGDQIVREVILGGEIAGEALVAFDRPELTRRLVAQWRAKGVPSLIPTRRRDKFGRPVPVSLENHAALVARDQVSKLNGQLNRARQQAAGIDSATWSTQGDSRVRPDHVALEGVVFLWAEGAAGGIIPGGPINCRCWGVPVIDKEQVLASGGLIPVDGEFTRRVRALDPGPGAAIPGPTEFSFDQ